jgi:hypothetical protein
MNPLKSFFTKNAAPSAAITEPFAPSSSSPRYAYAFQSPFKQPRILILVDHIRAPYFLSFHYVLERLHRDESLAFFVIDSDEITRWGQTKSSHAPEAFVQQVIADVQPTLVIFSRYGLPDGDRLLELFKAQKIATVYHCNEACAEGDDAQKAQQVLLAQSNLIYASTAVLAERYGTQFPEQSVFNGIYAPYLDFLLTQKPNPKQSPLTIGYTGSQSQQADLDAIAPAIVQVLERNPNLRFETLGTIAIPSALQAFGARVTAHSTRLDARLDTRLDYAEFLNQLAQLNWAIGLAPLNDTEFNRCQAPTPYIEYTTCCMATLAGSGNVYAQFPPDSHILIAQPGEWADKIQQLIDHNSLRESLVANAKAYCAQTFSLNVLESQIKEMIALV